MDQNILNLMSLNAPSAIQFLIFALIIVVVIIRMYEPIKIIVNGLDEFVSSIWEFIEDHI